MEKNRILNAAIGCIITVIFSFSISGAQDDTQDESPYTVDPEDSLFHETDTEEIPDSLEKATEGIFEKDKPDSLRESPERLIVRVEPDTTDTLHLETLNPTVYYRRDYLSRGVGDEMKRFPNIFMCAMGPTGSPQIPLRYLNVPGIEIYLNDHPFLYNDIYRPYVIGSDLNAIPWEILNDIYWDDRHSLDGGIHFDLGRPPDDENRSDVEIARGPYGYNSSRWRFFRPFGAKTYGYFTVGFKEANGYLQNSDYDGYHVNGGGSRIIFGGLLKVDAWKYRAKSGVNTFEFLTPQAFRHSRTTRRYEASYTRGVGGYLDFKLFGMYQKNGLIAGGFIDTVSIDSDIGGGKILLDKDVNDNNVNLGASYYRLRLYKLPGVEPSVNQFDYFGKLSGEFNKFDYRLDATYSWNGVDHGAFLPAAFAQFNAGDYLKPFVSFSRSRKLPDLQLIHFNNEFNVIGVPSLMAFYSFDSRPDLRSPVSSRATGGFDAELGPTNWKISASYMKIDDQIYLSYQSDTLANVTITPVNFDDEFLEITGTMNFSYGIFDGELGGSFKKWKERYFDDGLEKGPAAIGFGRLSASRSFFFDDLFLGGSLEFSGASRRDYRSVRVGLTEWYAVFNGRLEFRYKNFIFWWNEDNLINENYTTWWPYPERPRTLWWGFRWRFYD